MPNFSEYQQPPVTRKEQVDLRSPEGKKLKLWVSEVIPSALAGFMFSESKRITIPIPKESGVYFALYQNLPVYVGQSCCLHRRIHSSHLTLSALKRCGLPIYFSWQVLPRAHRLKAETLLIRRFQPIFNIESFGLLNGEIARAAIASLKEN